MKPKRLVKLHFRELKTIVIVADNELSVKPAICTSQVHPRCHGFFIPIDEDLAECKLCKIYKNCKA